MGDGPFARQAVGVAQLVLAIQYDGSLRDICHEACLDIGILAADFPL